MGKWSLGVFYLVIEISMMYDFILVHTVIITNIYTYSYLQMKRPFIRF